MIKAAGFERLLLWWGEDDELSRSERVSAAHRCGLETENAHASPDGVNSIWLEGEEGERKINDYLKSVYDCASLGIETLVVHLSSGNTPPPISGIGIKRVERLIGYAEQLGIKLAFENMRIAGYTRYVLDNYNLPCVGLCYDSGHENYWNRDVDWLKLYGNRVFAVHLHDNKGDADSHMVPFDGGIDWVKKAEALAASSYFENSVRCIPLECEFHPGKYYDILGFDGFLDKAYGNGMVLYEMLTRFVLSGRESFDMGLLGI